MSLLSRNSRVGQVAALVAASCVFGSHGALAADGYFTPELAVTGEHHTNVDLDNNSPLKGDVFGYSALASGVIGWKTPRNITEFRPRVQFYDYPDRKELQRTNESVDLNSQYVSLRSQWELVGSYSKQSTYEAQRNAAQYDEFDPNNPIVNTASSTSRISDTRTLVQVRPSYTYKFSQRVGAEVEAIYQTEHFGGGSSNVDYRYLLARTTLLWDLDPKNQLGTGVYGSKFKADNGDNVTAKGVTLGLLHNWSPTLTGSAIVNFEDTKVDGALPDDSNNTNNWGVDLSLNKRGQISNVRLNVGRTFNPSGAGSTTVVDQVRVQYWRNFKQRWTFLGAVRAYRTRVQGAQAQSNDDRDYASAYSQLSWNVTRTWSVNGSYSYYWRKFPVTGNRGEDQVVSLGVAYKGLRPQ